MGAGELRKATKVGVQQRLVECPTIVLSTCVVMKKDSEESNLDSDIINGESLNEALKRMSSSNVILRKRLVSLESEIKVMKDHIRSLINKKYNDE